VDLFLSFILSIVAGLASGWIVSWMFKRNESKEEWYKNLVDDKQAQVNFLNMLKFEVSQIKTQLDQNAHETPDSATILRLILNQPKTPSFIIENLDGSSEKHILGASRLVKEIEDYFQKGEINNSDLINFESRLIRAVFDTLMIKKK
jgi:hypothetical protein